MKNFTKNMREKIGKNYFIFNEQKICVAKSITKHFYQKVIIFEHV